MSIAEHSKSPLNWKQWPPMLRLVIFTGIGVVLWKFPTKGIQDILLWLAFAYALTRARRSRCVWDNAAGFACLVLFIYSIASLFWSCDRVLSMREAAKTLDVFAFAFAIPIIFDRKDKIESALLYGASAFTCIVGWDRIRLRLLLKGEILARAHAFEPFILFHSNVASMAAGAAFFVLLYFAWKRRRDPRSLALCVIGMVIDLAYMFVAESRGPQAAFAATVALAVLALLLSGGRRRMLLWLLPVALSGAVALVALNPRFRDMASMHDVAGRATVWKHAWKLAQDRPVLGYGFGRQVFVEVYHGSNPPASPFYFVHPHQYWLCVLFAQGWVGVALHAAVWLLLMFRLLRHIFRRLKTFEERLLPGVVALLIVFIHIYSLADWPAAAIYVMLVWLIPVVLALTCGELPVCGGNYAASCRLSRPGARGHILFVGPFNGGVGGVERLTRYFADWVEGSGYTATMVLEHRFLPECIYTIRDSPNVRVFDGSDWSRALAAARHDFAYVIPVGLSSHRWLPRLRRIAGPRIVLDLDQDRKFLDVTDVLHCETPRDEPLPRPHIVALPDPHSTIPAGVLEAPRSLGDYYLTAFNPYGDIKGHCEIPAFMEATGKRMVWCFDPISFERRKRKYGDMIRRNVAEVRHPLLELVEAPDPQALYRLYRECGGYVSFSRKESLGFSMLDAVVLGKPLCARRVGVCHMLDGFQATDDFSRPVFSSYSLPETPGYGALFTQVSRMFSRESCTVA